MKKHGFHWKKLGHHGTWGDVTSVRRSCRVIGPWAMRNQETLWSSRPGAETHLRCTMLTTMLTTMLSTMSTPDVGKSCSIYPELPIRCLIRQWFLHVSSNPWGPAYDVPRVMQTRWPPSLFVAPCVKAFNLTYEVDSILRPFAKTHNMTRFQWFLWIF